MAHDVKPVEEAPIFANDELVITETIELTDPDDMSKAQLKALDAAIDKVDDELDHMGAGEMADDPTPEEIEAMVAKEAEE